MLKPAKAIVVMITSLSMSLAVAAPMLPMQTADLGSGFGLTPGDDLTCHPESTDNARAERPSGDVMWQCESFYVECPQEVLCGAYDGCGAVVAPCSYGTEFSLTACCLPNGDLFSCSSGHVTYYRCPCDYCSDYQYTLTCH